MLAAREHSRRELRNKLLQRGHDPELIEQVLDDLQASSLQSDARYAQQFVESRVTRGQGPVRIRMELRERGVDDALVREAMAPYDDEWPELLNGVHDAKYGQERTGDYKEAARRARFLESRGFPGDLVRRFLFD
ncbi:MAG: regulatory protein RecX [Candidatus Thiodiazotropha sp.]